jgi:ornithine carbamoyltransferase
VSATLLTPALKGKSYTRVGAWSKDELAVVLDLAHELKHERAHRKELRLLPGRTIGLVFYKPSTRTRVGFEVGIKELGGAALVLPVADLQLSRGESVRDTALVLSRMLSALMIRAFSQADIEEFAKYASIPVINGLSDTTHPLQALADAMTIRERLGGLEGVKLAWVGDGNNVCASLVRLGARFGMELVIASPPGYELDPAVVEAARRDGGNVQLVRDPREAVAGADVISTDVFVSMGQEADRERRLRDLGPYQVNDELLSLASRDAFVLHCLPAHPGEEITAEVLYGPRCAAWDQAENRLHTQKALMALVIA